MAFRTFSDSAGTEWQVFDVVPRMSERRGAERRSVGALADPGAERRERDRRLTVGGSSSLGPTFRAGWLLFEHGDESRRLSPIPENWQHCSDSELDALLRVARKVAGKKERRG